MVDQSSIHTSIMGDNISFKFVIPKNSINSKHGNMITVHEKYILKQEKIQIIRGLDLRQRDKNAIFKLQKDIENKRT